MQMTMQEVDGKALLMLCSMLPIQFRPCNSHWPTYVHTLLLFIPYFPDSSGFVQDCFTDG